jgi:molybdenum cofactor guanylyltransferase
MTIGTKDLVGVILAGGQSRRMGGGDKGLLPLGTGAVIGHVIDRMSPQVSALAINANGDPARFLPYGLPVLPDSLPDFPGPLAGILAALDWAVSRGADWVVTVPSDTPFVPRDLVARLTAAQTAPVVIAATGDRVHPTCGLWSVGVRDDLAATLARGERKVRDFSDRHGAAMARFTDGPPDPFFNINTPADLAQAQGWL